MNRSRNFTLVLYPNENEKDLSTLTYIVNNFEYAYIEHNQDVWEEDTEEHKKGEKKKPHTHVLINLKNARSVKSMLEELEVNHIESCNFYAYARYLIHLGYPNKYQYNSQDIKTNMSLRIENALKRDFNSEEQDSRILINFIKSHQSALTFMQLVEFAMENDCLIELRRNTYMYKCLCDDIGFKRW